MSKLKPVPTKTIIRILVKLGFVKIEGFSTGLLTGGFERWKILTTTNSFGSSCTRTAKLFVVSRTAYSIPPVFDRRFLISDKKDHTYSSGIPTEEAPSSPRIPENKSASDYYTKY